MEILSRWAHGLAAILVMAGLVLPPGMGSLRGADAANLGGGTVQSASEIRALTRALSDVRTQRQAFVAQMEGLPLATGQFHRHPDGTLHFHPLDALLDPLAPGAPTGAAVGLFSVTGLVPAGPAEPQAVTWGLPALGAARTVPGTPLPALWSEDPPPRADS